MPLICNQPLKEFHSSWFYAHRERVSGFYARSPVASLKFLSLFISSLLPFFVSYAFRFLSFCLYFFFMLLSSLLLFISFSYPSFHMHFFLIFLFLSFLYLFRTFIFRFSFSSSFLSSIVCMSASLFIYFLYTLCFIILSPQVTCNLATAAALNATRS
jgi:hypothetical protein